MQYFVPIFNDSEVEEAIASATSGAGITVEEFRHRYQK
jgi:hypothetical protein